MKKIFILFVSLVFIAAMTGCQAAVIPAVTADTPDTADTVDTVDIADPVDTADTAETVDTVENNPLGDAMLTTASAGSYSFTLDVNPSIELTVQDGIVTGAVAYNDDGQAILLSANVAGLSADGAIDTIIAEIAGAGYLSATDKEQYVLLTVAGGEENPELSEELKEYTEQALEGAGVDSEVKTVAISSDIVDGAAAQGMSAGRYMVLQYIAREEGITFEEAVALYGSMSIGQLMEQFEDLDEAFDEDGDNDIEDIDEDGDDQGEDEDENDDEDNDQDDDQDDDDQGGNGGGDDQGEDD